MKAATLALLPAVAMATLKEHNLQRNSTETGDLYGRQQDNILFLLFNYLTN
jgi:hypothetical protein